MKTMLPGGFVLGLASIGGVSGCSGLDDKGTVLEPTPQVSPATRNLPDPPSKFVDKRGRTWDRYPAVFAPEPPPGSNVIRSKGSDSPEKVRDYLTMSDEEVAELIRPITLVGQYEYRLHSPPLKEARELKEMMRQQDRGELQLSRGEPSETTLGVIEEDLQGQIIIGSSDTRVKKRDNLAFPWRTIMWVTDAVSKTAMCTAQLIGRSTATSVAHCFHNGSAWLPTRVMATGVDGEDANPFPDGIMECSWAIAIPGGYDGTDEEYDFATLESSDMFPDTCNLYPGDWAGYLGFWPNYAPSSSQHGYVYGFPFSGCPGASNCNRPQIWGIGHNNMDEDGWNVDHYADTSAGQSGAALYIVVSGNRYLIGNHFGGFENPFDEWNEARRLSDLFYSYLTSYTAL